MRTRRAFAAAATALAILLPVSSAGAAPKPTKPAVPASKPAALNWTLTGAVGVVDPAASTVEVVTRGGNARPRVTTVVTVPATAVVVVDGVVADLTAVTTGQDVLVKGRRTGSTVLITRVEVTTPAVPAV
jgi:hypothetical protein